MPLISSEANIWVKGNTWVEKINAETQKKTHGKSGRLPNDDDNDDDGNDS